jgi:CDP-4-dehydro-6-deoxyglucose reductase
MPKITFMPLGLRFEVEEGTTILLAAIRNGVPLRHDCTEAICGTDRVRIVSGSENLSEKNDNEELTLEMMKAGSDNRLGCVAQVLGDVVVEISK